MLSGVDLFAGVNLFSNSIIFMSCSTRVLCYPCIMAIDAAANATVDDYAVKADVESASAPDALCNKVVLLASNMKLLFCSIAFYCFSS